MSVVLYDFVGSCWCQVPKLAIEETGLSGKVELKSVNLAEGANFNPDFLKINPHGTVPVLVTDDGHKPHVYDDSTNATRELLKRAPNAPAKDTHTDHELDKLIREIHSDHHDPNVLLLLAVDDQDRAAKASGLAAAFLGGRQKALDKYASEGGEFANFLKQKQQNNGALLSFYTSEPDQATKNKMYSDAQKQWTSAGNFIRSEVSHLIRKTPGKFLGGASTPGEADYHLITWLARIITDAGGKPGSSWQQATSALQSRIGPETIEPAVGQYWDAWIQRPSFQKLGVH